MQIQEIVTTGKLSKLEHFETDEKVKIESSFSIEFRLNFFFYLWTYFYKIRLLYKDWLACISGGKFYGKEVPSNIYLPFNIFFPIFYR